ncbi:MAG: hypothetical protein ACJ8AK_06925 [Gemmatimonadaceae bacterium]
MTERNNDNRNKSGAADDSEESLEKELSREAKEGADSLGDVGSNRTLSGSSSWETLPDESSDGGNAKSGDKPSQSPSSPRKESR